VQEGSSKLHCAGHLPPQAPQLTCCAAARQAAPLEHAIPAQRLRGASLSVCLAHPPHHPSPQVSALREAVLYLVRSTETALHTFKRSYAWREAAKVRCGGVGWKAA